MQKNIHHETENAPLITAEEMLAHWQGHRNLTRKVIQSFPDDKLFTYSIGGMRPFAELVMEMHGMAVPGLEGIVTRKWGIPAHMKDLPMPKTKSELLQLWDEATLQLNELWPQIPDGRFQETDKAFGQWEGPIYWTLLYFIDNEIHHRAQGYVYLRSLGIEPPPFWER